MHFLSLRLQFRSKQLLTKTRTSDGSFSAAALKRLNTASFLMLHSPVSLQAAIRDGADSQRKSFASPDDKSFNSFQSEDSGVGLDQSADVTHVANPLSAYGASSLPIDVPQYSDTQYSYLGIDRAGEGGGEEQYDYEYDEEQPYTPSSRVYMDDGRYYTVEDGELFVHPPLEDVPSFINNSEGTDDESSSDSEGRGDGDGGGVFRPPWHQPAATQLDTAYGDEEIVPTTGGAAAAAGGGGEEKTATDEGKEAAPEDWRKKRFGRLSVSSRDSPPVAAAAAAAAAGQLQDLSCGWATALQPGSGVELFWTDHTSLPASLSVSGVRGGLTMWLIVSTHLLWWVGAGFPFGRNSPLIASAVRIRACSEPCFQPTSSEL